MTADKHDFIADLTSDDVERSKLRALGVETAEHLLAQIEAAREPFEQYFGPGRAKALVERLNVLLGDRVHRAPSEAHYSFGVPMDRQPPDRLPPAPIDLERRDSLFRRIQKLKQSRAAEAEIREAEAELDRLLDSPDR